MSDSLKNILLGALLGALIVGLLMHARGERARRAPASAMGPPAGAPASAGTRPAAQPDSRGGGAFSQAPVNVVAAPVRMERLSLDIEALGNARASESVDITAKVSNLVTAIRFEEGQQVKKGQVLVELDSEQARADLAIAEATVSESRSQYQRSQDLYATKVLSEQQIEQIEATLKANEARVAAARARLGDTVIRAPFAGRVGLRRLSVGSLINPGTIITTLDDTSTIKLDFTVPELHLSAVKPGLEVTAQSVAYPDVTFTGKVASVDSRVDPSTRSFTVRALVPNAAGRLKPGMFLTVRLARTAADVLLVPEEAIVPESGDVFVFVVRDGAAEKRRIRTGTRQVGAVQVTEGLTVGELVVTEGTQKLRDGAQVAVAESAAQATPAFAQGPEDKS